jgi:DNA-binding CsgD family transcriptional regulator
VSSTRVSALAVALHISKPRSDLPPPTALTAAEVAVAKLAASGLSNTAIATERKCAIRTVANQLAIIYQKLGLSGRRELKAFLSRGRLDVPSAPQPGGLPGPSLVPAGGRPLRTQTDCLGKVIEDVFAGRLSLLEARSNAGERHWLASLNSPALAAERALSARERQILLLTAQGRSNKLIAYELGISSSSVSTYLRRARGKADFEHVASVLGQLPNQSGPRPLALRDCFRTAESGGRAMSR